MISWTGDERVDDRRSIWKREPLDSLDASERSAIRLVTDQPATQPGAAPRVVSALRRLTARSPGR
jgi:hypothetical protein